MDDRHNEVLSVATLFFVLTWLTVSLRCYVRGIMMKTWGTDDYCMVATLFWYLCELLYVLANCLLKFAIGFFYLRVAMQRWHIWCIRLLMMGTVLFGLTYLLLVIFQCNPVNEFWNNHPASEKCLPKGPTLGITYALAAVNAAADWAFGTLPFFIVWDLEMKLKTKLLVAGILAFAAIGSTGTVVRMFYIHTLMDGPDFLWRTTDIAIWSTVEPGIGIVAGSIACLRPLFRVWLWRLGFAPPPRNGWSRTYHHSNSGQKRNDRRGYRRSLSPSDLVPTEFNGTTSTEIYGPRKWDNETMNLPSLPPEIVVTEPESEQESYGRGHILQTVTVEHEHEYHEAPPRLELRHSFRNSFTRGSILSLSKFRIPTS
ncbi:hypothetical protein EK21DRAFT_103588 [Setomelanomma holmii]|uniref:Rhodopsin domain-containing protein n=1 Tax=Setomelanomma holmii TaxID=210430 RepID=A0A9P4H381_9PLEO|nr:hypothetical protein EK21DRAFT_103588 [Setomelanomma holmii]